MAMPQVIAIYLTGKPQPGVGPHVALSIVGATYANGYVKNKVMEFVGDGIADLPMEYRNAIDVMTTETTCWSSIWETDEKTQEYLTIHGRAQDYAKLAPAEVAYYDGVVYDLSEIKPVIALPFHPSNVFTIEQFNANALDILDEKRKNPLPSSLAAAASASTSRASITTAPSMWTRALLPAARAAPSTASAR